MSNGEAVCLAATIAELSEGLPWWTTPEGATTSHDKILDGIRAGENPCPVDFLNNLNLIARLSSEKAKEGRNTTTLTFFDRRIEVAQDAIARRQQIDAIVARQHPSLSVEPPEGERYALLGDYTATDTWIAWRGKEKVTMVRLEKVSKDDI